ncbi:MAG: 2-oxoglutarate dehydrogenase complex dihydrolipoyllysine-residue succinyltransferase [Solirubrobacteraceae bacterium]
MLQEIKIPSPGESISEVEIASWLVKEGDYVEKDQPIAEIDSDKATLELPAEVSGTISFKAKEGDVVKVGQIVCVIDTSAAKPAENSLNFSKEEIKPIVTENIVLQEKIIQKVEPIVTSSTYAKGTPSPAAKKLLDEKNIDPSTLTGSGKDGRITKEDALNAQPSFGSLVNTNGINRTSSSVKLSVLRRKVAERLVAVKNETAMLTTFNEVDMSGIMALRKEFNEAFKTKHGVSLGFMSFFTKAVVRALKLFPDVNSMIDENQKITFDYCDISIAVSGPKGLMVPVIRNAETLSFRGIEQRIKELATKVKDGKITVDDMTGGTFTITNGGTFGSMLSTPIINPPQSGILGMHNIVERPVAINGKVEIRPIMYVALSYDHRIVDGKESVGFLVAVKEAIENPVDFLCEGKDNIKKLLEL